jgi:precorrin-2 dehydrogenase/sirohydrochlorin ferrochelatase
MKYYPIYLDISNKRCAVIGGGDVAERKVVRLMDCGGLVTVIGKTLSPALQALKDEKRIEHVASDYREEHLDGAFLVIGATDRADVNEQICRDARSRNVLVNIVDDSAHCDFILPSVVERGDLALAVSTAGKSPALAKKMRMELEKLYGPEYEIFLWVLGVLRDRILSRGGPAEANRSLFESLVDSDLLEMIRGKDWNSVKMRIKELTGETVDDFGD